MGTASNKLHTIRPFNSDYKGQSCLDFANEEDLPLSPNTSYYWQVALREQGKDNNYYGGEYIKSPVMQFNTVASGADLAITNITLGGNLKPDSTVPFYVTVTNQGNETADYVRCIESVYIKNNVENLFRVGRKCMDKHLTPGSKETVEVKVRFAEGVEEYNGKTYDNVLVTGESQIRFQFDIPNDQDMNSGNDHFVQTLDYQNTGPVIQAIEVSEYGDMYDSSGSFWARMGKTLGVTVHAKDDLPITNVSIQYRLRQTDGWTVALNETNETSSVGRRYKWLIPTHIEPTHEAQIRIVVRNKDNQEVSTVSKLFSIYSNQLEATIAPASPSYQVGSDLTYKISGYVPNGISRIEVILWCGSYSDYIHTEVATDKVQGLILADSYQWPIHNDSSFAATDCHLDLQMGDLVGNRIEVSSSNFSIEVVDSDGDGIADDLDSDNDNDGLPDSYETQYAFLDAFNSSDAEQDQDNDGLSNLKEYLQGTDPQEVNTVPVTPAVKITNIAACIAHTLALDETGQVWAWGKNNYGQLGDGSKANKNKPIAVSGMIDVKAISCGRYFSMVLKQDGSVWTWGKNGDGELGNGAFNDQLHPVQVRNLSNVKAIAGGWYHGLALKQDGSVWGWGQNAYGQLGISNTNDQPVPVKVMSLNGATAITGSRYLSAAVVNGNVWTWGKNKAGLLGNGTTNYDYFTSSPVRVSHLTNVTQIAADIVHIVALRSDGFVWGWGGIADV